VPYHVPRLAPLGQALLGGQIVPLVVPFVNGGGAVGLGQAVEMGELEAGLGHGAEHGLRRRGRGVVEGDEMSLEVVVSGGAGVLEGKVADAAGKPVHNGLVALVPDSPLRERKDYYGAYKETRTDQNGGFEIGGITPGAYQVYAWADAPASIFRNADFMKAFVGKGTRLAMEINGKMKVELSQLQ